MSNYSPQKDLKDVMPYIVHRGVIVEKLIGGYRVLNQTVKTVREVDKIIDQAVTNLSKSIIKKLTMKFIVNANELNKGLKKVAPAVNNNNIIPIMNNVLCSVNKNGTCELIAHNGHLSISTTVPCTSDKSFQVLLPFKQIQSIASTMSEPITIECKDGITIKGVKGQVFQLGQPDVVEDFTLAESFEPIIETEISGEFVYYMQKASRCISKNKEEYGWAKYICLDATKNELTVASTDKMQLMMFTEAIKNNIELKVSFDEAFSLALSGQQGGKLSMNERNIRFECADITVSQILAEQKYADYKAIMIKKEPNLTINKSDLVSAMEQMGTLISGISVFTLGISDNKIKLSFDDKDMNKHFETTLDAKHSLEPIEIYLNAILFKNILSVYPDAENVNIYIQNGKPVYLNSDDNTLNLLINPLVNKN